MPRARARSPAWAAAACLGAAPACAQPAIEVYGRVDAGIAHVRGAGALFGLGQTHDDFRSLGGSRSRIGVRARDELGRGWDVRAVMEQSFAVQDTRSTCGAATPSGDGPDCGTTPAFDALLVASISHYAKGRLDLGRRSSIVADVALDSQTFGGETIAGDPDAALLREPCAGRPLHRPLGVAYESPMVVNWKFAAQYQPRSDKLEASHCPTPPALPSAVALTVGYADGTTLVTVGASRRADGQWLLPLGVVRNVDRWRVSVSATVGRTTEGRSHYAALGAASPIVHRGELRLAASQWRIGASPPARKLAAGFHYALSPRFVAYADAAAVRGGPNRQQARAIDLGVRLSF